MGEVIAIVPHQAVEQAWEDYAVLARQIAADSALIANRGHMDRMRWAERRWKDIANRIDAQ